MSKIKYNSPNMMNYTKEHIKNCTNFLNKAVSTSSGMTEPSSYSDIGYLTNLSSKIKEDLDSLNNLNNWISENNSQFTNIVKNNEHTISGIDTLVIQKRIGYISRK